MIVAIHQPNYMPWMGYFDKINKTDVFIFMDNVQYSKRSYINRVRIKTPYGIPWLTVPVETKGTLQQKIVKVKIANEQKWVRRHLRALRLSYGRSAYFAEYYPLIENVLSRRWDLLADLNIEIINSICKVLDMRRMFIRGCELEAKGSATDLLTNMVQAVKGDSYLCGGGAGAYQEDEKFAQNNLGLVYQDFRHPTHPQLFGDFLPGLSIIDALFNIGAKRVGQLLAESKESWKTKGKIDVDEN